MSKIKRVDGRYGCTGCYNLIIEQTGIKLCGATREFSDYNIEEGYAKYRYKIIKNDDDSASWCPLERFNNGGT